MRIMDMPRSELFALDDKVAIVIGASRGIGAVVASGLARAGATVIGIARSPERTEMDAAWEYRRLDASDQRGFEGLCQEIARSHSRLDILVNAAGVSFNTTESLDEQIATFDRTIQI